MREHAGREGYQFVGPVKLDLHLDPQLSVSTFAIESELVEGDDRPSDWLVFPDGRRVGIGSQVVTIGRLPECAVVLDDPNVSRRHAQVRREGDAVFVVDLGSTNGTRVNGVAGSRAPPRRGRRDLRRDDCSQVRALLGSGDLMPHSLLELLRYSLLAAIWLFFIYAARMVWVEVRRSRAEQPQAPAAAPVAADKALVLRLRVVDPPQRRGRVFELGDEVTVGRSPGCAVPLDDDTFASSIHARVFRRSGELWIEDLGSTNGTFLNDERLDVPARLRRGDRVKVGSTILEVAR